MSYEPLVNDNFLSKLREKRKKIIAYNEKYVEEKIRMLLKTPVYDDVKLLKRATDYYVNLISENAGKSGFITNLDTTYDIAGFSILQHVWGVMNTDTILGGSKVYLNACHKYIMNAFSVLMASISEQTGISIRNDVEYKDHTDGKNHLTEGISLRSGKKNYYFHIWW